MNAWVHRVLVVDDALTTRLYVHQILAGMGFAVSEAANGIEGLERIAAELPDLLLVDVNMPKMDGYAMLRAIRAQPQTRDIPAIMISTQTEVRDAALAYAAGANVYIVKPLLAEQLRSLARLLVGDHV